MTIGPISGPNTLTAKKCYVSVIKKCRDDGTLSSRVTHVTLACDSITPSSEIPNELTINGIRYVRKDR